MGWSGVGIPTVARHFSPLQNIGTGSRAYPASYSMGTGILSKEYGGWGVMLTSPFHLMLMLRMSGAIPILHVVAWTGTTMPVSFIVVNIS